MSVEKIVATVQCDGCGQRFQVDLDEAATKTGRVGKWSMFELVEDILRGGLNFMGYIPTKKPFEKPMFTSVRGHLHLCPECTAKTDAELTEEEI